MNSFRIFKVVSLFNYQGSLFCCRISSTTCLLYHSYFCLSTTFFISFCCVMTHQRQLLYFITSFHICQLLFLHTLLLFTSFDNFFQTCLLLFFCDTIQIQHFVSLNFHFFAFRLTQDSGLSAQFYVSSLLG